MTHPRNTSARNTSARNPSRSAPTPAPATRGQLLEAARLGATVAASDLVGRPDDAGPTYASWRRLRRRADRQSRQLLRVAFDTGYGQAMQGAGTTPQSR